MGLHPSPISSKHAIVVGGGVGGLSVAGRLARSGLRVTILEKNSMIGGRLQSEYLGDWRFDTGPSLLLFKDRYEETFEALGSPLSSCGVELKKVEPAAYRVFFADSPDGFSIDILYDDSAMAEQLESIETGAGAGYMRFLEMAKSHLEIGVPNFIDRDFEKLADARNLYDLIPDVLRGKINPWYLLGPHNAVMKGFFRDQRLCAAFTFQDLYVGLTPRTAPAVFSLLAATEICDGVYYPIGGFGSIRNAFRTALDKLGVSIQTNAAVASIQVNEKNAVEGIVFESGEFLSADIVISNRDLPMTYSLLRGGTAEEYGAQKTEKLAGYRYSSGVIAYNWALTGPAPSKLRHHNVFLSEEWSRAWKPATKEASFPKHPNFYVHVPSRTDPTAAPPGCDSVMVLLPVSNLSNKGVDFTELIQAGRRRVLDTLKGAGLEDLEPLIGQELVIAPPEWQHRYSLQYGAAFGLSHGIGQLSIFRPANKDDHISGLYFVGASTRPGNGVPLCMIGARLTAERIIKDL